MIENLLRISGYTQKLLNEEDADIRLIPISDLEYYKTVCGEEDKLHFTNNAIDFLKNLDILEVAIIYCDGQNYRYVMEILLKIDRENAKKFCTIVNDNGGALIVNKTDGDMILLSSYE